MNPVILRLFLGVALMGALLMHSCKSELEDAPPVITIQAPYANSTYQAGDTISLSATFSDDIQLQLVRVVLIDKEGKPVLTPFEIVSPPNPFHLNLEYPIDDISLASGTYELKFQAEDASKLTNQFLPIQVSEVPREFRNPVLITCPAGNLVNVYRIRDQLPERIWSRQGDYSGAAINSLQKTLYLCGAYQSGLAAIDLEDVGEDWNIPPKQTIHNRWFESISLQDQVICVSFYEGYVKGIDPLGQTIFTTTASGIDFPEYAIQAYGYIVAVLREYAGERHSIAFYYYPGGTLRQKIPAVPAILDIQPLSPNLSLSFGNENGMGCIGLLNMNAGTHTIIHRLFNDSITAVDAMDQDNYIIAGKQGVYWYRYSQNSLVDFAADLPDARVRCEKESRYVFIASENKLQIYSFPEAVPTQVVLLDEPIRDVLLLYNR